MKNIVWGWVGLVITLGAVWYFWTGYLTRQSIRRVLKEDAALPALVLKNAGVLDKYWDSSSMVLDLVANMDRIDMNGCPADFQIAYKNHIAAWGGMARTKANNEGFNGFLKGFFTGGIAVIPALNAFDESQKRIQESWLEIQKSAIKHGVAPAAK